MKSCFASVFIIFALITRNENERGALFGDTSTGCYLVKFVVPPVRGAWLNEHCSAFRHVLDSMGSFIRFVRSFGEPLKRG